jgi:hypothetical protein
MLTDSFRSGNLAAATDRVRYVYGVPEICGRKIVLGDQLRLGNTTMVSIL